MITKNKKIAFTLVELIVVITILAILATIGFMSFQSYTIDSRDSKRVTDLTEIRKGLEVYKAKKQVYPMPDTKYVTISGYSYQGYVGNGVLSELRGNADFKDPLDKSNYTYVTTLDKNKYQLMTMLEKDKTNFSISLLKTTYSEGTDYTNRFPYVIGDTIGAITDLNKTPIQEVYTGELILSSYSTGLIIYESNTDSTTGTGGEILNALNTTPVETTGCILGTSKIGECNL